jgi:hypothetical protein
MNRSMMQSLVDQHVSELRNLSRTPAGVRVPKAHRSAGRVTLGWWLIDTGLRLVTAPSDRRRQATIGTMRKVAS